MSNFLLSLVFFCNSSHSSLYSLVIFSVHLHFTLFSPHFWFFLILPPPSHTSCCLSWCLILCYKLFSWNVLLSDFNIMCFFLLLRARDYPHISMLACIIVMKVYIELSELYSMVGGCVEITQLPSPISWDQLKTGEQKVKMRLIWPLVPCCSQSNNRPEPRRVSPCTPRQKILPPSPLCKVQEDPLSFPSPFQTTAALSTTTSAFFSKGSILKSG